MTIKLNDDVRVRVRVPVTRAGMAEKNAEFLTINRKIDAVADEKAGAMSSYNSELKELRKKRKTLMDTMEEGYETVEVDAYERVNEQLMQIETVRRDTGKVVPELTRPMSAEERQLDLGDVEPRGRRAESEEGKDEAEDEEAEGEDDASEEAEDSDEDEDSEEGEDDDEDEAEEGDDSEEEDAAE